MGVPGTGEPVPASARGKVNRILHPDTRRFAFSVNEESKSELWVMENFLRPLKVAK